MVDLKQQLGERLRSAQQWIVHAEDAFNKKKDIRGELDLLLAQAELQRIREANRPGRWYNKYSFLSQIAALGLAVIMVTVGIGGAYWWIKREEQPQAISQVVVYRDSQPIQEAKSETKTSESPVPRAVAEPPQSPVQSEVQVVQPVHQVVPHAEDHIVAAAAVQEDKPKEDAKKDKVISPDEMQKLVRVAGKSLRGQ